MAVTDVIPTSMLTWILFNIFIVIMLALDLFVFHRKSHEVSVKEASWWAVFWVSLALLFNVYIYFSRGPESAISFLTGYLIEESLSIDNLFVFMLIFRYFRTPRILLHKVLFWGVLGAIVFRAVFIWLGITLLGMFHWIIYIFGAFLVYTGIKLALEKDKEIDPEQNPVLKLVHKFIPFTNKYEGDKFFVLKNSVYYATTLFVVLVAVETTDIVFAIDSIPAILAITSDPFIVYTSNIFAVLGLRNLYFVLENVMSLFHYLHYGLSAILVFIGIKMLIAGFYHISTVFSLGFVFGVLALSVILSILFPQKIDLKKGPKGH